MKQYINRNSLKWLPYLLLPLGILIGFSLPRDDEEPFKANQESRSARTNRTTSNSSENKRLDRIRLDRVRTLADQILALKGDGFVFVSPAPDPIDVEIADVPAVIEHLLSQAGPTGLPWEVCSEIDRMLSLWAKEDFDSAYHWAMRHPNRNARNEFLEATLKEHAKTNFDETLALIKSFVEDDEVQVELAWELFPTAAKYGAKEAFELLVANPPKSLGAGGASGEFPKGFDFKTFAELSAKHMKDHKNNPHIFSHFPSDLLSEWGKVDAAAALEFYVANERLPCNDLGNITKHFLNMAEPASNYPWLAEKYGSLPSEQQTRFAKDLQSVFPQQMGPAPLVGLANSMPSPELREQLATDMLKGVHTVSFKIAILNVLPTPEKRLEAINENKIGYSLRGVSDEQLAALGITRAQIRASK